MANVNQVGFLSINDSDDLIMVTNCVITFNRGAKSVSAVISCTGEYTDKSPVFDYFVQNQPAKLKLSFTNLINSAGETTRTITFNNALCKDYLEDYDRDKEFNEFTDIFNVITIEADNAAMGETSFPG
jgi:hypothetical protein